MYLTSSGSNLSKISVLRLCLVLFLAEISLQLFFFHLSVRAVLSHILFFTFLSIFCKTKDRALEHKAQFVDSLSFVL